MEPRRLIEHALDVLRAQFEGQSAAYWGYPDDVNPYTASDFHPDLAVVWLYAKHTYHNPPVAVSEAV